MTRKTPLTTSLVVGNATIYKGHQPILSLVITNKIRWLRICSSLSFSFHLSFSLRWTLAFWLSPSLHSRSFIHSFRTRKPLRQKMQCTCDKLVCSQCERRINKTHHACLSLASHSLSLLISSVCIAFSCKATLSSHLTVKSSDDWERFA